jgi:pSer/pThr/pTyr-binding forkhead associated (FHA) protein
MVDPNFLSAHSLAPNFGHSDPELEKRLALYQVFQRLYDQNRALLDEILKIETSGASALGGAMFPYVQGIVVQHNVYLVTNLIGSKSRVLTQPQCLWTIGRDSQRVNVPVRDRRLSRYHAAIEYITDEGFYLKDLGSSNGSFINGELVRQHSPLNDGDRVRLGSLTFTFFVPRRIHHLSELSQEQVSQVSLTDIPPTMPLDPDYQDDSLYGIDGFGVPSKMGIDDTSSFMRDRDQ